MPSSRRTSRYSRGKADSENNEEQAQKTCVWLNPRRAARPHLCPQRPAPGPHWVSHNLQLLPRTQVLGLDFLFPWPWRLPYPPPLSFCIPPPTPPQRVPSVSGAAFGRVAAYLPSALPTVLSRQQPALPTWSTPYARSPCSCLMNSPSGPAWAITIHVLTQEPSMGSLCRVEGSAPCPDPICCACPHSLHGF